MGDRTWAEIRIHKDFKHIVGNDNDKICEQYGLCEVEEDGDEVIFKDDQANYGHIEDLENVLKEHEIEFTLDWEAGCEYSAGKEYWRKFEGKYQENTIYESQQDTLNALEEILREYSPDRLEEGIRKTIKYLRPFEETPLKGINSKRFIQED